MPRGSLIITVPPKEMGILKALARDRAPEKVVSDVVVEWLKAEYRTPRELAAIKTCNRARLLVTNPKVEGAGRMPSYWVLHDKRSGLYITLDQGHLSVRIRDSFAISMQDPDRLGARPRIILGKKKAVDTATRAINGLWHKYYPNALANM